MIGVVQDKAAARAVFGPSAPPDGAELNGVAMVETPDGPPTTLAVVLGSGGRTRVTLWKHGVQLAVQGIDKVLWAEDVPPADRAKILAAAVRFPLGTAAESGATGAEVVVISRKARLVSVSLAPQEKANGYHMAQSLTRLYPGANVIPASVWDQMKVSLADDLKRGEIVIREKAKAA